jgi:hypothetical protein
MTASVAGNQKLKTELRSKMIITNQTQRARGIFSSRRLVSPKSDEGGSVAKTETADCAKRQSSEAT